MTATRKYPGLSARAFEHPADSAALSALRKMTGFDTVLKKIMGAFGERRMRMLFLANGVRLGPNQLPRVHALLAEVCEAFDLGDPPELYVVSSPFPNAMAVGVDAPFIVLHSSALETMSDDELRCILAHEAAHILSGHVLYKTMLLVLMQMSRWMVPGPFMAMALPILLALKEWDRKSELSADRASLLVARDLDQAMRVIFKLAGGRDFDTYNLEEFERQAREYKEGGSFADNVFKVLNLMWLSHPFPVLRLVELKAWAGSDQYRALLEGSYPRRDADPAASVREDLAAGARSYRESLSGFLDEVTGLGGDLMKTFFKDRKGPRDAE